MAEAGVVDQQVDALGGSRASTACQALLGRPGRRAAPRRTRRIAGFSSVGASRRAALVAGDENQGEAVGGQAAGEGGADAGGRARDQCGRHGRTLTSRHRIPYRPRIPATCRPATAHGPGPSVPGGRGIFVRRVGVEGMSSVSPITVVVLAVALTGLLGRRAGARRVTCSGAHRRLAASAPPAATPAGETPGRTAAASARPAGQLRFTKFAELDQPVALAVRKDDRSSTSPSRAASCAP